MSDSKFGAGDFTPGGSVEVVVDVVVVVVDVVVVVVDVVVVGVNRTLYVLLLEGSKTSLPL